MKIYLFALLLLVPLSGLVASGKKSKINPKTKSHTMGIDASLRSEMNKISSQIRSLAPYFASESEFKKSTNKDLIVKNITEIQNRFANLKLHPTIEIEGLSLNQLIMSEELKDVVLLVEKGKTIQGRAKLLSTLNLCVSCHAQSPGMSKAKLFSDTDISKLKISNFEKAELYFVTREYETALGIYNALLEKSKVTDDDEILLKALERQLIYFVKIKKDFNPGKEYFTKLLKGTKFSDAVKSEVSDWIKMLGEKPLWENFDPKSVKEEEMDKFLSKFISDEEEGPIFTTTNSSEVYDLNLSSILLDYYNANPTSKIGGKVLYWLAILDKRINDDLFFSLGDFYLMACMEKYSKDPIAKECFEAYVDELEINFVTSDKVKGKNKKEDARILEIESKIERLKKLVDYKEEIIKD